MPGRRRVRRPGPLSVVAAALGASRVVLAVPVGYLTVLTASAWVATARRHAPRPGHRDPLRHPHPGARRGGSHRRHPRRPRRPRLPGRAQLGPRRRRPLQRPHGRAGRRRRCRRTREHIEQPGQGTGAAVVARCGAGRRRCVRPADRRRRHRRRRHRGRAGVPRSRRRPARGWCDRRAGPVPRARPRCLRRPRHCAAPPSPCAITSGRSGAPRSAARAGCSATAWRSARRCCGRAPGPIT